MKTFKQYSSTVLLSVLFMLTIFVAGCGSSDSNTVLTEECTPPIITSTIPVDNSTNVPVNTPISATFSKGINPDSVNAGTFTVIDANSEIIPGMVSYSDNNTVMIFTPDNSLDYNTTYTATITTDVTDMDGYALDISNGLNVWSFTTINEADVFPPTDNTPPIVVSTIPVDGATNVSLNRIINALFSKELDAGTIENTTAFTLHNDTLDIEVNGTVTYNNAIRTAYFTPTGGLTPGTNYTATITTDVTDTNGLNLNDSNGLNIWSFSTAIEGSESAIAAGPEPVNLGTAGEFVILTKSGITNVPTSAITGNIGASPITAAALNDVSCSEMAVGSFIHGVNAAYTGSPTCFVAYSTLVNGAVLDMGIAYTDAAGRTNPTATELGAGNITGLNIVPGLYKWSTGVLITGAGVTLTGGANDVWIFQISENLTVMSDAIITLAGGAQAKNIFWQVEGENTTIGTGAHFEGIVLGAKLIAVQTGAEVNGRLLSQTAVTLEKNIITQPAE